jgi:lysophospholipase L1-like esterase
MNRRPFLTTSALALLSLLFPAQAFSTRKRLPNVLILGDSISIGYYPFVKDALEGKVNLHRPTLPQGGFENCAGTTHGVSKIKEWIGDTQWDLIHFNFGLHDIKHIDPQTGKNSSRFDDPQQASPEQYEKNLDFIVQKLKKTNAKLIFATTTPYPDSNLKPARKPGMHKVYNTVARHVMEKHNVYINDLHAFVLPRIQELQRPQNVHFSELGSQELAKIVVKTILKYL